MNKGFLNWFLFIVLSIIWGSSFKLMKLGLDGLSAYQVAAIRMISAGIVLLPFCIKALKAIPKKLIGYVVLSGFLGSFFPAFLFCIAETKIDSALAGILNSLTPLFTIIVGSLFFNLHVTTQKIVGVVIGLVGLILLFAVKGDIGFQYIAYASLVLLATIFYAVNVNLVSKHMKGIGALQIAAVAFVILIIPSSIILFYTGYFNLPLASTQLINANVASLTLGVLGTAVASILFYQLLKNAGAIFAAMVTYGIPFVAVFWGLLSGESITLLQVACLGIILLGVYLANRKKS